ncbi:MAG: phosphoglycerate mutase, partial [bacterium]
RAKGLNSANMIWLWSPGRTPTVPNFKDKYGVTGGVISAVDVVRGIGVLAGLEIIRVPGATGYFDTDYQAKGAAAVKLLKTADFALVHVEAPDEAGHEGLVQEKIKAIEQMDEKILGPLLKAQPKLGDLSILLMPDHPTPVTVKGHVDDPVPFALWRSNAPQAGPATYDEETAKSGALQIEEGFRTLDHLFGVK